MQVLKEQFTSLGTVVETENGKKIQLKSTAHYQTQVNKLPVGKEVHIDVSTKIPTRSQQQRRYYFVLVGYVADHTGFTKDELHSWIMIEKFGTKTVTVNGKTHEVRQSISDVAIMTSFQCMELIDYVLELAGDLGVNVPTQEELGFISNN